VNNSVRRFVVEGREILVGRLAGKYYALDERCTHRGVPRRKGLLRVKSSHALGIMDNLISQRASEGSSACGTAEKLRASSRGVGHSYFNSMWILSDHFVQEAAE